jgi:hypothetical protein
MGIFFFKINTYISKVKLILVVGPKGKWARVCYQPQIGYRICQIGKKS